MKREKTVIIGRNTLNSMRIEQSVDDDYSDKRTWSWSIYAYAGTDIILRSIIVAEYNL